MREGLSREFPEAPRAIAWTRDRIGGWRPVLRTEPVVWATISGIGAGLLAAYLARTLVGLTAEAFLALRSPMPFALFPLVTIAGVAAAAAVALRIGGLFALALSVAYLTLDQALRVPGVMTFCERSGGVAVQFPFSEQCTAAGYLTSLWPQFVGLGLGIAFSRVIRARGTGINSVPRIAGGYALALFVMSQLWAATAPQASSPLTSGLTIAAGAAAAAAAAGVIAAQLPRGVRSAAIVAGISLLPWLIFQIPTTLRIPASSVAAENVVPMLISIVIQPIAAAFLVLSAAITSRARFIPRDAA